MSFNTTSWMPPGRIGVGWGGRERGFWMRGFLAEEGSVCRLKSRLIKAGKGGSRLGREPAGVPPLCRLLRKDECGWWDGPILDGRENNRWFARSTYGEARCD